MRVQIGSRRFAKKSTDPTLEMLRKATTEATSPYGINGAKTKRKPKPITLPKVSCLKDSADG